MEKDLVTVIIPCYNSEKWISESIDSVLNQTYENIEIIIVDDGSTDGTAKIISDYISKYNNIIYIEQENKGPAFARNTGIKNARGNYIAFLDSDDLWRSNKLEKQMDIFRLNSNISLVLTNVDVVDENKIKLSTHKNKLPKNKQKLITQFFLGNITMNTPTILTKKDVLYNVGLFNIDLKMREDHFLLMSIAKNHEIYLIDEQLVKRRKTKESTSVNFHTHETIALFEPFILKSIEKFPFLNQYKDRAYSRLYMQVARKHWENKNIKESKYFFKKSIKTNPLFFRNYFFIVLVYLQIDYTVLAKIKKKIRK